MSRMVLGITGGIGSGKSYVCRLLAARYHIPIYYCDIHAALLMRSDYELMEQLSELVPGLYDKDGELDKQRLASYMFSDEQHLRSVNAIVHPAVRRHLREWKEHRCEGLLAVESAILYESHFDTEVDKVLYVDAPMEVSIQRTCLRDGLTEQEVKERITYQQTEQARFRADFVVNNDGQHDLLPELDKIINNL